MEHDFSNAPHILLVDDEPGILRSLGIFLRRRGYLAQTAADVSQALRLLDCCAFDLLITDIQFGARPDGLRLIDTVTERWPDMPVLAISAHMSDRRVVRPKRTVPLLEKPFGLTDLDQAMRGMLCTAA